MTIGTKENSVFTDIGPNFHQLELDNNNSVTSVSTYIEQVQQPKLLVESNNSNSQEYNIYAEPAYVENVIDQDSSTLCIAKIFDTLCCCFDTENKFIDEYNSLYWTDKILNILCCCTLKFIKTPLNLLFRQLCLVWCFIDDDGYVSWCWNKETDYDLNSDELNCEFEPFGITSNMCDFNNYACERGLLLKLSVIPTTIATFFVRLLYAFFGVFVLALCILALLIFLAFLPLGAILWIVGSIFLEFKKIVVGICQDI